MAKRYILSLDLLYNGISKSPNLFLGILGRERRRSRKNLRGKFLASLDEICDFGAEVSDGVSRKTCGALRGVPARGGSGKDRSKARTLERGGDFSLFFNFFSFFSFPTAENPFSFTIYMQGDLKHDYLFFFTFRLRGGFGHC